MKIAIVGSREWVDYDEVERYVGMLSTSDIVISGGARGVDTRAVEFAKRRGLVTIVLLPDWNTHGKAAGVIRNAQIVEQSEVVLAFWDSKSKGTLDTIRKALNAPHIKRVTVIKPNTG
jgi:predicted Rossmann fold nucleotide-binding protein DprA/Smf involved in DNA uptake